MSEILSMIDPNNYGLQSMVATGGGGEVNLQSKDVTINQNGTTTITADTGYDGLSDVDVTVSGILDTSDANATSGDIARNKTAYVNNQKLTGTVYDIDGGAYVDINYYNYSNDTSHSQYIIRGRNEIDRLYRAYTYPAVNIPYNTLATIVGAEASKIKKDEVICGVTGTYEGTSTSKEEKDVNFYDYDGTVVQSYTKSEFLALQSMPTNPTHEGLTPQGWNWSLADAQDFVTDYGILDIGQIYITNDGKTRIYISLLDERKSPYLGFAINGTATIDWGDNSSTEQVTGSDITTVINTPHTYSTGGNYVISIASESPIYFIEQSEKSSVLNGNGVADDYYRGTIWKIEIGTNMNTYKLNYCTGLKYLSVPNNVTNMSNLLHCEGLNHLNVPTGLTYCNFWYCYSIKYIVTSNISLGSGSYIYANCRNLKRLIDTQRTGYSNNEFNGNLNLQAILFPKISIGLYQSMRVNNLDSLLLIVLGNMAKVPSSCFQNNKSMKKYYFTNCTVVPQLENVNAFSNMPTDCQIIVPDALYEDWIVANNWSTYASQIVKASEA